MNLTVYWREIKTPAHPRHCRDSDGGGGTNDWCINAHKKLKIDTTTLAENLERG